MSGIQSSGLGRLQHDRCFSYLNLAIDRIHLGFQLRKNLPVSLQPSIYILTNKRNGTLYVGVTSNLAARVQTHRLGINKGFTTEFGLTKLVYYELFQTMPEAIRRENQLKKWNRLWKIRLIEEFNPKWNDLFYFLD